MCSNAPAVMVQMLLAKGICETTQKPIAKERLLAVPFTRYSTEAKREVERHSHRAIERGGLFGDGTEEEGGKLANGGDDE